MRKLSIRKLLGSNVFLLILIIIIAVAIPFFCHKSAKKIKDTYYSNSEYTISEYTNQTAKVISREIENMLAELEMQSERLTRLDSSEKERINELVAGYYEDETPEHLYLNEVVYPLDKQGNNYTGFTKNYYYSESGVIDPYINNQGKVCFGLYLELTLADGARAFLYKEIPMELIQEFCASYSYSNISSSYIISNKGQILCNSDRAYVETYEITLFQQLRDDNPTGKREVITAVANSVDAKEEVITELKIKDSMSVICFAPINDTNWCLVSAIPKATIDEQLKKIARSIIKTIFGTALLIVLISIIYVHRMLKKQKANDERYSNEKRMMVSAVAETHSTVMEINLETGQVITLFDDGKLTFDVSKFAYYDDFEKMVMGLVKAQYAEVMSETFSLKNLKDSLNEDNRNIYSEIEFSINGDKHWVAIDVTLVDSKYALYMIRFIDNEKLEDLRKREALSIALDSAERANEAKTTFLNSMSHDVRTPMNAICGMTEIARVNLDDKEKVAECLDKITASSQKLLALLNDILEVTKIEGGSTRVDESDFDIIELFEKMPDLIKSEADEKKHTVTMKIGEINHKYVTGDTSKLQQIFRNVVINSVKYTETGGKIKLSVKEIATVGDDCAEYEFTCSDNGIGMKKDFLPKVFEPFERSDEARVIDNQGAGLGLVIARNLVRMMAGDIKVESTYRRGSTFTVKFRLKYKDKSKESIQETSNESNQLAAFEEKDYSDKRVLVVEDNELNREIAVEILEMTGAMVECAEDGCEAVDMFEDNASFYYDMILMDINMPNMDGHEASRTIRAMNREDANSIPIIAMSANAFMEDMTSSINAGMNEHIGKPISLPKLLKVMETYL